jgi:hypothetical protein
MANSTTEQSQRSKDKKIIQEIGFQDFSTICQEYQIIEKATRELLEIANDIDTPVRVKVDIFKWVVEMNIGKPKQMNDINLQKEDDVIKKVQVNFVSEKDIKKELEKLKQEILDMGYSEEKIEERIDTIRKPMNEIPRSKE